MTIRVLGLGTSSPAGGVVGVSCRGHHHVDVGGVCGREGTPITEDTCFDLASVTKVVGTTSMLHRLAALGEIGLDDRVRRYIPWAADVTLRTLAYHRSGLWEWQPLYLSSESPLGTIEHLPLRYAVDKERHYSDLGFIIAGLVIQAVTGTTLDVAFEDLVAFPVGLTHTRYGPIAGPTASGGIGDTVEKEMVSRGVPYPILLNNPAFPWRTGEVHGVANDGNAYHCFRGVAGHAGLFSHAGDLLLLMDSFIREDLWGRETTADIFTEGPDKGQAFGWRTMTVGFQGKSRQMVWHGGFTGCAIGFIPGECAVVMLTNRLLAPNPTDTVDLWKMTLGCLGRDLSDKGVCR